MIKHIRRGLLSAGAVLSIAALGVPLAGAQSNTNNSNRAANGFRISPVRSELTIEKGKSQTITVTVENPTDIATTAQPIVNDFVASDDESGTPRLILDNNVSAPKNSFKTLVSPIGNVQLAAREKKDVSVRVSIPQDGNSGGYYGAIRFIPLNGDSQQSNVGLTASVGTIVLVTVPGNLSQKVNLKQLTSTQNGKPKSFFTSGEVGVLTRLENVGDIHVQPFGRVEVKGPFNKTVTSYEFNNVEPRANILPGSARKFENSIPKDKKLFGRYTIQASLGYAQGSGDLIIAKASFWYVPTWALYALGVLLLVIVGAVYFLVRKFTGGKHKK